MSNQLRLPLVLGLAGTLPFIAGTAILWLGPAAYAPPALQGLITWAAVTLSFLGGIQWGIGISVSDAAPKSGAKFRRLTKP